MEMEMEMEKEVRCEKECKEIQAAWEKLKDLGRRRQLEPRETRERYCREIQSQNQRNDDDLSQQLLSMWMLDPMERDAVVAKEALDHPTEINYVALLEMFVGRKSSHVVLIKQAYHSMFRRILDQDIVCIEPPHPYYKKILVALVASHRAHHADVSLHIAKCDAIRLFQTGEGRGGPIDEAVVLEILSKRSIPQLKLTFSSYNHIYGHDYAKTLKNDNRGEFEDALKMVVKCIYNPPKYYAKRLYESIKGKTGDKGSLGRVLMSRAEVDMEEIERAFKNKYGTEVREAMCESIPSGDYRDFLLGLATTTPTLTS